MVKALPQCGQVISCMVWVSARAGDLRQPGESASSGARRAPTSRALRGQPHPRHLYLVHELPGEARPTLEDFREEVVCLPQGRPCFGLESEVQRGVGVPVEHVRENPIVVLKGPGCVDSSLLLHCFTPGGKKLRGMVRVAVGARQVAQQQGDVGLVLLGAGALVDAVSQNPHREFARLKGSIVFAALTI